MKVISYNSRILDPQEQKLTTPDRELLGLVHALQIYEFLIIGSPHPIHIFTDQKLLSYCFTKKRNLSPRFYRAQMQLTKISELKNHHTPGKNLSVAYVKSFFTKTELQINQIKHKQLPPRIEFAVLQNTTLKPVHISIRMNDKGNDIFAKLFNSFSFKSVTPFQIKFETPIKKNNNSLH